MNDPLNEFAANLRRLRKEHEVSQEGLARAASLHVTHVAKIERAERDPGVRTVVKLADGLGVPPAELFQNIETR